MHLGNYETLLFCCNDVNTVRTPEKQMKPAGYIVHASYSVANFNECLPPFAGFRVWTDTKSSKWRKDTHSLNSNW